MAKNYYSSDDKTAKISDGVLDVLQTDLKGRTNKVLSASFSPDGKKLIFAAADRTAKVWNAVSGKLLLLLKTYRQWSCPSSFLRMGKEYSAIFSNSNLLSNLVKQFSIW